MLSSNSSAQHSLSILKKSLKWIIFKVKRYQVSYICIKNNVIFQTAMQYFRISSMLPNSKPSQIRVAKLLAETFSNVQYVRERVLCYKLVQMPRNRCNAILIRTAPQRSRTELKITTFRDIPKRTNNNRDKLKTPQKLHHTSPTQRVCKPINSADL